MKKEIKKLDIIVLILSLILVMVNIYIYRTKVVRPINTAKNKEIVKEIYSEEDDQEIEDETEEDELANRREELKSLGERDRMELYFSKYIEYVENEEYRSAYNLLYSEFRNTYFDTLEKYEEYVKNKYPAMLDIEYTNIERQGDIYVLFINVKNLFNEEEAFEQKIVIRENDFDSFELSFNV